MFLLKNKNSLAIALYPSNPAIYFIILIYSLFNTIYYYKFGYSLFSFFQIVECEKINFENTLNPISFTSSQISNSKTNTDSQISEGRTNTYNMNVNTDAMTTLGEGLKIIGKALESYTPVITETGITTGTAIIFKTLPKKERATAMITAGLISGGIVVLSQMINKINTKEKKSIVNEIQNLENKPDWNSTPNRSMTSSPDFSSNTYNSPLEELTNIDMLVISIMVIDLGVLLGIILIFINFLIKLFDLESKQFIINRPKLHKLVSFSLKMRDYTSYFLLFFVLFSSCFILVGLSYLLHFLRIINI
jgi:hypothetical protein